MRNQIFDVGVACSIKLAVSSARDAREQTEALLKRLRTKDGAPGVFDITTVITSFINTDEEDQGLGGEEGTGSSTS